MRSVRFGHYRYVILCSLALLALPATAQNLIELVQIEVVFPEGQEARNTTLFPEQDNVWDVQLSEPYRVFVTYRVRVGVPDVRAHVALVQKRSDTGELLTSQVTAADFILSNGHTLNELAPATIVTARGPGLNGLGLRVAVRPDTGIVSGPAPPLEYQLLLESSTGLLASSDVLHVRTPTETGADYRISNIEVVQTVQDSAGSVPLVANKPTLARVYVEAAEGSEPGADRVTARLSARQVGGNRLGTISPRFRRRFVRPTAAGVAPDRNTAASSLIYVFPESWTQAGRLTLEAELDIESLPESDDLSNNITRTGVRFDEKQRLKVVYIPICLASIGDETVCPAPGDMTLQDLLAEDLLPLPDRGIDYQGPPLLLSAVDPDPYRSPSVVAVHPSPLIRVAGLPGLANFASAYQQLAQAVSLDSDIDAWALMLPRGTRIQGEQPFDREPYRFSTFRPQVSRAPTFLMTATPTLEGETNFAAALTRALGGDLATPNCAGLVVPFGPPWPNAAGSIEATDTGGSQDAVGFDVPLLELKPADLRDVTTGCEFDDVWISGLNFTKLFRRIPAPFNGLNKETPPSQATGHLLLSRASFNSDGSGAELLSTTRLDSALEVIPLAAGDYCVEVHNPDGLFSRECFGVPAPLFANVPTPDEFSVASSLPFPADATAIRLTYQGQELLARAPSDAVPEVNFTAPLAGDRWEGGEQTLAWTGSDADGDTLSYTVFASTDGGMVWRPLSSPLSRTELRLNAGLLTASDVHFRVLVNDGFHSAEAVLGPIVVDTTPQIEAPAELDLGFAVVEDSARGELMIHNKGNGWLEVGEATIDNPLFEVQGIIDPIRIPAGDHATLDLSFLPVAVGVETATLTIQSNAEDQPERTINLRAEGVDAETPTIAVSSNVLNLGELDPDQQATRSISITNTSAADLTVQVSVSGSGFSLQSPDQLSLSAVDPPAAVTVSFRGSTEGVYSGALVLSSNDPNQPAVEVALSATVLTSDDGGGGSDPRPAISTNGVRNAATFQAGMVQGSWVTIFGENLATSTRTWDGAINGSTLPTELDGVVVLIGGKRAAVFFISPGQLNVQVPDGLSPGPVSVQVVVDGATSETLTASLSEAAPGFFTFDPEGRRYLAAVHLDGTFVGKDGLFGGAVATRAASPGDRILLFGTGFGPTNPATPAGVIPAVAQLALPVSVTIGGIDAVVEFSGIVGAGLYQFNVIIPAGVQTGDAEVAATVGAVSSPSQTFLTIGQ